MSNEPEAVKAVVFDFGGVITEDVFRSMGGNAVRLGFDPAEFAAIAIGQGNYGAGDHPWHRLERGEIEIDEYNDATDRMAKERGHGGFSPLPVGLITKSVLKLREEMMTLLADLRTRGVPTGILTNNVRALGAWRTLVDWDSKVDVVIDSCEVGMRKPEARIYQHTCAALGVDPSDALFLDDMQPNVDGAIAVGMQAILVSDPSAAIAEVLRRVG